MTTHINDSNHCPIFIVGTSRSGTTLIKQILDRHSDLSIIDETHYFDDLRVKAGREQQPLSPEEAKLTEDYFLRLTHQIYQAGGDPDPDKGWMNRGELRTLAQQLGTGTDSYFEAFCQLWAQRRHKTRWGEKTPRHIFKIAEILERYPNAKIVCMVRHPGGVLASYRDFWKSQWKSDRSIVPSAEKRRAKNSYHPITISLIWKAAFNAALEARRQFGDRVYIQRFEDLILEPETTLQKLTEWLSLDYQPYMLQVGLVNSSYSKTWSQSEASFSDKPAYRWREKLSNTEIAIFQSCCGSLIDEAGYERESIRVSPALIIWSWLTLPLAVVRGLLANRTRIGNLPDYIWRRLRLAMISDFSK